MFGATRRRTQFAVILTVLAGFISASPTAAQATPADWPQARSGAHAMAYDARRGLALMYGDRSADSTTLWGWDGQRWHAFPSDEGPGLRRHIKLAYDSARDRLVMYGGYDSSGRTILGDTWEWDGARWQRVATEGPGPRSSYTLVYDAARSQVILFGGLSDQGTKGDTWGWNGVQWTKLADAGPSPRGEASAVYDPRTQEIILAGGFPYERVTFANGRSTWSVLRDQIAADTWAWNGRTWRLLDDAGTARFSPMSIDPATGGPLRIAGESQGSFHGDMLRWSQGTWEAVPGDTIPARHGPAATLDTRRNRVVLYGGSPQRGDPFGDLWEWDGARWTEIPRPSASLRTTGAFFALSVPDLEASAQWYAETFAMRVILEAQSENVKIRALEGGGLIVELIERTDAVPFATVAPNAADVIGVHGIVKAGVIVEDWDALLRLLAERNVDILIGPFPKRPEQRANLIIRDNSGNLIQFFGQ